MEWEGNTTITYRDDEECCHCRSFCWISALELLLLVKFDIFCLCFCLINQFKSAMNHFILRPHNLKNISVYSDHCGRKTAWCELLQWLTPLLLAHDTFFFYQINYIFKRIFRKKNHMTIILKSHQSLLVWHFFQWINNTNLCLYNVSYPWIIRDLYSLCKYKKNEYSIIVCVSHKTGWHVEKYKLGYNWKREFLSQIIKDTD